MNQNTTLITDLKGRLRNINLPKQDALMPMFEAVVNSIHSIEESGIGFDKSDIKVSILRSTQKIIQDTEENIGEANITGFSISDNGIGFNDKNLESFKTLDSLYKIEKGCKGIGRLLWLKAFDSVSVSSCFKSDNKKIVKRNFTFSINGISDFTEEIIDKKSPIKTTVELRIP